MFSFTFILVFVLCFAVAAICILICNALVNTYDAPFNRFYFYYLLSFFAFSIYAIWGQIAFQAIVATLETNNEVKLLITNFITVLGMPFLIVAMIMLIKMAFALVDTPMKRNALYLNLVVFLFIAIVTAGLYWANQEAQLPPKTGSFYVIVLILGAELTYIFLFIGIIWRNLKKVQRGKREKIKRLTLLLFVGFFLRGVSLTFYEVKPWILPPLILLYFISHLPALGYLRKHSDSVFEPIAAKQPNANKKELLYQKYQITRREREIIEQICLGKTNQQIADTLFISLQTVKDHTHRIYTKVGINSRMRLVQMINS